MTMDQEARDRADHALAVASSHEILCNERWQQQALAMQRVEDAVKAVTAALNDKIGQLPAGIIATLSGLVGYLGARAFPFH